MSAPIHVRGSVSIPESELGWRFSRSSGRAGSTSTPAPPRPSSPSTWRTPRPCPSTCGRALDRLSGRLVRGVLTIRAEEYRSQQRNRDAARTRLATLLAEATAPPPKKRIPKKVPRGINERRLENKKRRSAIKRQRTTRWD